MAACKRPLARVGTHVLGQVGALRECLATALVWAHKGLLARVRALVDRQTASHSK